eukprot:CAMPEP_0178440640 /NCGR_PEP_ID=MMETSP0689_2-20121128/36909_1 /TAXON_ID=160604 /ORGANISM="Amphidinium massartii, Strain CS-259" /LENGTH=481 /DNA_ID=CAMNT_0020063473 /DNA_START=166 /DNA_END=1611 /DNA_ORIENTATION=-
MGWEYYEISLSDYPEKRPDMLALCDRLTVPQVFFNEKHLGGASEVRELHESGQLTKLYAVMAHSPDPRDGRLQRPSYPPKPEVMASKRTDEALCIGGTDCVDYVALVAKLQQNLDIHDRRTGLFSKARRCFTGSNLVDLLMRDFQLRSRSEAVQVGSSFVQSCVIQTLDGSEAFQDSQKALYQLYGDDDVLVLNRFRPWTDRVDPAMVVVASLKKKLYAVQSRHTDPHGLVDYIAMAKDSSWQAFREATCELQKIDLIKSMDENTKIAFVMNLYNLAVIFAFTELGIPQTDLARLTFFNQVKIDVGGHLWSLHDLESGILRSNRAAPYHLSKPFSAKDPRLSAILAQPENRIHFGLNCGAKSCPPVKTFTAEGLQEELRIVAMAFCEQDENVRVDVGKNGQVVLWLSKIFEWYKVDFNGGGLEVPKLMVSRGWLTGSKKARVESALAAGVLRVRSLPYDWSTNAKRSARYHALGDHARAAN